MLGRSNGNKPKNEIPGKLSVNYQDAKKIRKNVTLTGAGIMTIQNMIVCIVKYGLVPEIMEMGDVETTKQVMEYNSKLIVEVLTEMGVDIPEEAIKNINGKTGRVI